jgi:hypothetical protein
MVVEIGRTQILPRTHRLGSLNIARSRRWYYFFSQFLNGWGENWLFLFNIFTIFNQPFCFIWKKNCNSSLPLLLQDRWQKDEMMWHERITRRKKWCEKESLISFFLFLSSISSFDPYFFFSRKFYFFHLHIHFSHLTQDTSFRILLFQLWEEMNQKELKNN